jgi:peptide deformylase
MQPRIMVQCVLISKGHFMAVKKIIKMGNMHLASPSQVIVDLQDPMLPTIIADMRDTMLAEDGAGIAAPQIGHYVRIIMFGIEEENRRYPNRNRIPLTVLINPVITFLTEETELGWEGCLSVPGMRGLVPRYTKIEYSGLDVQGQPLTRVAEGFHARVVQHECDHLDGILYPFRIQDLRYFGFEDELATLF